MSDVAAGEAHSPDTQTPSNPGTMNSCLPGLGKQRCSSSQEGTNSLSKYCSCKGNLCSLERGTGIERAVHHTLRRILCIPTVFSAASGRRKSPLCLFSRVVIAHACVGTAQTALFTHRPLTGEEKLHRS